MNVFPRKTRGINSNMTYNILHTLLPPDQVMTLTSLYLQDLKQSHVPLMKYKDMQSVMKYKNEYILS